MIRRFIDIVAVVAILIVVILAIANRDSYISMSQPIAIESEAQECDSENFQMSNESAQTTDNQTEINEQEL